MLIVGGSMALAVAYGIVHDMVTAHVAVDYFTVYHPVLVDSQSPVVMALLWGFVATWWMGALLGAPIALTALAGAWPRLDPLRVLRREAILLAIVLACAMAVLGGVYVFATANRPPDGPADWDHRVRLISVALAHNLSYSLATIGGCTLAVWNIFTRRRLARASQPQP